MESEYKINAYETNQLKLYSVLGESESRTVIFNIIERPGTIAATSNAKPEDKPLDLTGYDISLALTDGGAVTEGTVLSAENGRLSFTLSEEFCNTVGEFNCEIVLSGESKVLKIIGIILSVEYPDQSEPDITITAGVTDGVTIVLTSQDGSIYTMQDGERLLFRAKRSLSDAEFALSIDILPGSKSGDGYNIIFSAQATSGLYGEYHYGIALQSSGELHPIIDDAALIVRRSIMSFV